MQNEQPMQVVGHDDKGETLHIAPVVEEAQGRDHQPAEPVVGEHGFPFVRRGAYVVGASRLGNPALTQSAAVWIGFYHSAKPFFTSESG